MRVQNSRAYVSNSLVDSHENVRTCKRDEWELIIDDFLASGATIQGLVRLAETAGAVVVGIGALIEKSFEQGRGILSGLDIPIRSLVSISAMDDESITFGN